MGQDWQVMSQHKEEHGTSLRSDNRNLITKKIKRNQLGKKVKSQARMLGDDRQQENMQG